MGQKTNPNLFRLITTKNYLSSWYSEKKQYSDYLKKDYFFKKIVTTNFEKVFNISSLKILRISGSQKDIICLNLTLLCPKEKDFFFKAYNFFSTKKDILSKKVIALLELKDENTIDFDLLSNLILNFIKKKSLTELSKFEKKNIYFIKISYIKNLYTDSPLLAKYIGEQIQKRTPYRRVLKQVLENLKNCNLKGAMILISGRLNGAEIARSENIRYGTVPLHTLTANIDYYPHKVNTEYGIIGIKVWLHKN